VSGRGGDGDGDGDAGALGLGTAAGAAGAVGFGDAAADSTVAEAPDGAAGCPVQAAASRANRRKHDRRRPLTIRSLYEGRNRRRRRVASISAPSKRYKTQYGW
jgi:hypothetical protein